MRQIPATVPFWTLHDSPLTLLAGIGLRGDFASPSTTGHQYSVPHKHQQHLWFQHDENAFTASLWNKPPLSHRWNSDTSPPPHHFKISAQRTDAPSKVPCRSTYVDWSRSYLHSDMRLSAAPPSSYEAYDPDDGCTN